jgi:acetolactate synthase-1/2/3 large subunit
MIKVTDYIANFLATQGVKHVFMLTGGGAMHLNDSLGKHKDLQVVFNHHEQACAMAAESYARLSNQLAVVNVTTGPGCINALNGVFGGWTDSIPMLIISGQVRLDTTIHGVGIPLRQMGDQECDIVSIAKPITKYAVLITEPKQIRYQLEKAVYLATHGRPGPVWVDIPLNIQGAMINEDELAAYDLPLNDKQEAPVIASATIARIAEKIRHAERPVLLVGTGVRLAGAAEELIQLVADLKIPVVTAFNAHDLMTDNNPYYAGRPGSIGDRAGNFAVQNADLLIVLGCRLNIRQIGFDWKSFARVAYKIGVDIDALELKKPSANFDLPIHGDAGEFIRQLHAVIKAQPLPEYTSWVNWCQERRQKYPVVLPEYWQRTDSINPYCFMQVLSERLTGQHIVVTANATACITAFQTFKMKAGQRLFSNSGSASMGYDLPAAIGAAVAGNGQTVVCLAGDGSIQLNIQELATIRQYNLPIKIFWLNNQGYHSIRQTQTNYFGSPHVGVGTDSGLFFPAADKIAAAYEMDYHQLRTHADMQDSITLALKGSDPAICEVMLTTEQAFAPKMGSKRLADGRMVSRPLEDMVPFLSREELQENMLIDVIQEEAH